MHLHSVMSCLCGGFHYKCNIQTAHLHVNDSQVNGAKRNPPLLPVVLLHWYHPQSCIKLWVSTVSDDFVSFNSNWTFTTAVSSHLKPFNWQNRVAGWILLWSSDNKMFEDEKYRSAFVRFVGNRQWLFNHDGSLTGQILIVGYGEQICISGHFFFARKYSATLQANHAKLTFLIIR